MAEYRVTFDGTIEVAGVFAENEEETVDSAKDIVCVEAAKTSFNIYLHNAYDVEEE